MSVYPVVSAADSAKAAGNKTADIKKLLVAIAASPNTVLALNYLDNDPLQKGDIA